MNYYLTFLLTAIVLYLCDDVEMTCTDNHGSSVPEGTNFCPGMDPCETCQCVNSEPAYCRIKQCGPPPAKCHSYILGSECCEYICQDLTNLNLLYQNPNHTKILERVKRVDREEPTTDKETDVSDVINNIGIRIAKRVAYVLFGIKDPPQPKEVYRTKTIRIVSKPVYNSTTNPPPPVQWQPVQLPPAQYPPAQLPPAQYPPAQLPPAQLPPAQYPPAQFPPAQFPPAQLPPCQLPPVQLPPCQFPPPQLPPCQLPPAQLPPAQLPPCQFPPFQLPPAQFPPTQLRPVKLPPAKRPPAKLSPVQLLPAQFRQTQPPPAQPLQENEMSDMMY